MALTRNGTRQKSTCGASRCESDSTSDPANPCGADSGQPLTGFRLRHYVRRFSLEVVPDILDGEL